MKEGIWGIGLMIISLITFAVIGTMSNITTTNQQDYEFMKSAVESAMYDARDEVQYRRGICVCTKKTGSPINIEDVKDYKILRPNEESECDGMVKGTKVYDEGECRYLHGEYVVNGDIFTESLISRFGTVAKNQETYDITVQDVIEYPPKTSVKVVYYQYLFEAMGDENHPIDNQMDAIFEGKDIEVDEPTGQGKVEVGIKNCDFANIAGTVKIKNVSTGKEKSVTVPDKGWGTVTGEFAKAGSYLLIYGDKEVPYNVDPNDLSKTIRVYAWKTDLKDCPCDEPEIPEDPEDTPEETPEDTPEDTPSTPSTPGTCRWHYKNTSTKCKSTDPYSSQPKSGTSASCASPYTIKPNSISCKTPSGQEVAVDSIYTLYKKIRSLVAPGAGGGKLTCTWTCEKGHSDKTFYEASLTTKAKKSNQGAQATKSEASTACKNAQIEYCHGKKSDGYYDHITNNCKAVQNFKCVGYVKENGKSKKVEEIKYDQESNPQKTWCSGKTNCSCSCLG